MMVIIGMIIAAVVTGVIVWLRSKDISLKWYEWLMIALSVILFMFTFVNMQGSFSEREPTAAWMFLLVIGLPALILFTVPAQLVWRRNRAK